MKYKDEIKKFLGQKKNTKLLVLIFILGIALMLVPNGENKKNSGVVEKETHAALYKKETEKELKNALSKVKGAGSVEVLVSLSDEGESYVASNEKSEKSEKNFVSEKTYVLKNDDNGGESAVVLRKNMPRISGVLVIAEGACDENIKNELTMAVKAISGVRAHRIYVLVKK